MAKKNNVLHITYDMRIGGTEQVIKNLVEHSSSDKYKSFIYCLESPIGPWGQELAKTGVQISAGNRTPTLDLLLIRDIRNFIITNKINIVHCHQYTPFIYGLFASFFTSAHVIFTEHGRFYPDTYSWKRKFLNPILERLTSNITCISIATKYALVEHENFSFDRINVIYNGIKDLSLELHSESIESFKNKYDLSSDKTILGTVARLDPIKNQKMMISAFERVLREFPNTILLIVGDGELRKELENHALLLGIKSSVIFTGYITHPLVAIKAIDIFLLSSLSEGASMTLLEAMSLSKPCVVTDAGGNPEIISDNETGYVTKNSDPVAFSEAIKRLLRSKTLQNKMGAKARLIFESRFSVKNMVAAYESIYQHIETQQ